MLRGHLDSLTSLGYVEGWAFDVSAPARAVDVRVLRNGAPIASGLALGFREDLMNEGLGLGWCAFRLRLTAPLEDASGLFALVERRSGREIMSSDGLPFIDDSEATLSSIEQLTQADPTVIKGLWQLRKCEHLLMQFIRRHGVEHFLDAAYAYVLGRASDEGGRAQYTRCIRQASLTPVGVLEALGDSEEFRSKVRQLATPKSPCFPFI